MITKTQRTPPINSRTKLLCFDLETNGLHGQAFAVGALVIDADNKIHDEFTARIKLEGEVDPWVEQNVLPAIDDMPITHKNYEAMREAFWEWYVKTEPQVDYVLVSNGYPVEYRFLLDCQDANLNERYWQHPFPLIELSSMLLGLGLLNESAKNKLLRSALKEQNLKPHHPLHDAKASASIAFEAFRQAGLL